MTNVSIIIPVFNAAARLKECLNGVMMQAYKEFECILINDGSTDDSLSICQEYALKDRRFRVFDFPNGGPSKARNRGLDLVRSDWVTFIDADDVALPNYLENFISKNTNRDIEVQVIQSYLCHDKDGGEQDTLYPSKHLKNIVVSATDGAEYIEEDNLLYNWGVWCKIFSMEIIRKHKLRFEEDLHCGEDGLFWHKYLCFISKIVFSSNVGYIYFCPREYKSISRNGNALLKGKQRFVLAKNYRKIYVELSRKFSLKNNSTELLRRIYLDNYFKLALGLTSISDVRIGDLKKIKPQLKDFSFTKRENIYRLINIIPIRISKRFGQLLSIID